MTHRFCFPSSKLLALLPLLLSSLACNARYSGTILQLAKDGDPERGRTAFVDLGCHLCHRVAGANLPQSAGPVVATLGGEVDREITPVYLMTQVLDPFYRHAAARNPMEGYAGRMTVQQLTDIAAFLKAHSHLRPLPPETFLTGSRPGTSGGAGVERRHGV